MGYKEFGKSLCDFLVEKQTSDYLERGFDFDVFPGKLLHLYLPELYRCVGVDQPKKFHAHDVYGHSVRACAYMPRRLDLKLAALFHDIGKPATQTFKTVASRYGGPPELIAQFLGHAEVGAVMFKHIARRLDLEACGADVDRIERLIANHMFDWSCTATDKATKSFLTKIGQNDLVDQFRLREVDWLAAGLNTDITNSQGVVKDLAYAVSYLNRKKDFTRADLKINGNTLLSLGITGNDIGTVLDVCLDRVKGGLMFNDREGLLDYVKSNFSTWITKD